ncbi:putative transcription initiation factor iib [Naematelia encephala]|uniref:Transcription initiation factor IIB n=1 Tax=Naematelia encephala TaxID=71784 RepID=A0A1Y2BEU5_9TREE|nr:putative transcription initiation factor iib [Naematelia encephala]
MIAGIAGPKPPGPKYGQAVAPNLNVRQICPNCRSDPPNIIEEYSKGDLVCGDCGTILGDRIVDTRSEWRTFAGDENGDDPSRVGDAANPLLGGHLDTKISSQDGRTGLARDLQRAQSRANAQTNGKTNLVALSAAFQRIAEKCEVMNIPRNIVQRAQHVYKLADERRVIKGKNDAALIAACIIFATRGTSATRSFNEVLKVVKVSKKELGQTFLHLKAALANEQIGGADKGTMGASSTSDTVEGQLARYTNFLDIGNAIYNAAKFVAARGESRNGVAGRSPISIAAGVLWFSCILFESSIQPKEIAKIAEVSESTFKLICKNLASSLDEVIRPEWKTQYPNGYSALCQLGRINDSSRGGTPKPNGTGTPKPETGTPKPEVE